LIRFQGVVKQKLFIYRVMAVCGARGGPVPVHDKTPHFPCRRRREIAKRRSQRRDPLMIGWLHAL
jgi:hypothetical protein